MRRGLAIAVAALIVLIAGGWLVVRHMLASDLVRSTLEQQLTDRLGQPVHIAATAYDSKTIASMIIYLDGNKVWTGYVNNFDVWLNMRSGTHTIVVKAWEDVTGVVYQNSVKFKAN